MRIMATGDDHFCEEKRFDECVRVHDWIADRVHAEKPDLFLLDGDIFERKSLPVERLAVARFLRAVLEVCPVVMVRGNHDWPDDIEIFSKLKGKNQLIIEQQAAVHVVNGIAVAAMAWPNVAHLRASGMDERTALQNVLRGMGADIANHDGPKVAVGHWMIDGSVTSHGQPLIGHTMNVALDELAMLHCPLVLAGHVHKPQEWRFGDTEILYCGSPFRTAFGEVEEKSIVCAEWTGERWAVARMPTPARQMLLLEDEWGKEIGDYGWLVGLHGHPGADGVKGAEIRLRYRVDSDQREAAAEGVQMWVDKLMAEGAHSVKLEERVIAKTRARVPEMLAITDGAVEHEVVEENEHAKSTTERQLEVLWKARSEDIDPLRKARLLEKVSTIDIEAA